MRRFFNGKTAKRLLFLALIPLVSGNFENAILCIEENGQVAIEFPKNGTCGTSGLSEYDKEDCRRCTDISISSSTEVNSFKSSIKIKNTVVTANIHNLADIHPLNLGYYQNLPESSLFSQRFLSSVIIRI